MSINPFQYSTVSYKHSDAPQRTGSDDYDVTSSVLSDYDELELDNDDQSSYILFNPRSETANAPEFDILSLTNTISQEDEEEEDDDDEAAEPDAGPEPRRVESSISNKINSWYDSNLLSSDNVLVDDNIASWNVDELMESNYNTPGTKNELLNLFYGDDLFQYLDAEDIDKFKRFHKLLNIHKFLLAKNKLPSTVSATGPNSLLNQLILKILLATKRELFEEEDSLVLPYQPTPYEYAKYLTTTHKQPDTLISPSTFSETTGGSSLIMCGGVGFGGNSSWNDI